MDCRARGYAESSPELVVCTDSAGSSDILGQFQGLADKEDKTSNSAYIIEIIIRGLTRAYAWYGSRRGSLAIKKRLELHLQHLIVPSERACYELHKRS